VVGDRRRPVTIGDKRAAIRMAKAAALCSENSQQLACSDLRDEPATAVFAYFRILPHKFLAVWTTHVCLGCRCIRIQPPGRNDQDSEECEDTEQEA
jgi:hypothetical protein